MSPRQTSILIVVIFIINIFVTLFLTTQVVICTEKQLSSFKKDNKAWQESINRSNNSGVLSTITAQLALINNDIDSMQKEIISINEAYTTLALECVILKDSYVKKFGAVWANIDSNKENMDSFQKKLDNLSEELKNLKIKTKSKSPTKKENYVSPNNCIRPRN